MLAKVVCYQAAMLIMHEMIELGRVNGNTL